MNKSMKRKSIAIIAAILLVVSVLYTPGACTVSAASASVSVTESGSWGDGTNTSTCLTVPLRIVQLVQSQTGR